MSLSQRVGAICLFATFIAMVLAAHMAYGPLAASAVFAVLVCPLLIGLVFCLPETSEAGAPGQASMPLAEHGLVRP